LKERHIEALTGIEAGFKNIHFKKFSGIKVASVFDSLPSVLVVSVAVLF
jgi:hypothetical protein